MLGLLAACTPQVPQAVLNVPGSATVSFEPSLVNPNGAPWGTVVMCLDEATAVQLDFSWSVGYTLNWQGTQYTSLPDPIGVSSYTTPVLQPGCGTLGVGHTPCYQFCYPRPSHITITATKV